MENKSTAFDLTFIALQYPKVEIDLSQYNLGTTDEAEIKSVLDGIRSLQTDSAVIQQDQREFMLKMQKIYMDNTENTYDAMIGLKNSLKDVIGQAKRAYSYVLYMYVITFYLGIGLILAAVIFAVYGKTILSIAFGAIGLIDLVTYFIAKPPLELQSSRANLAQLMTALISWFSDVINLNSYITLVMERTRATGTIDFEEFKKVSDKQAENTERMMKMIEEYSEPSHKKA